MLSIPFVLAERSNAVEVSLEENKAQRGNIGYVDMQSVFRQYPETQKAKQNFEEVVRQAEEQVNTRKAELISLRAETARLKMQRDFLAKNPTIPSNSKPKHTPEPGPSVDSNSTVSTDTAVSSMTPSGQMLMHLPGLAPTESSAAGAAVTAQSSLQEMDQKIAETTQTLQTKESEFKTYQAQVEKNLIDLESRRTEILLGRIYVVIQDVAQKEGVSVVIDKSQILFGQRAVDLTNKVLDKLKNQ